MPNQDKRFNRDYWAYAEPDEREAIFAEAITEMFGNVPKVEHFARIAAYLSNADWCNDAFQNVVDPALSQAYTNLANVNNNNNNNNAQVPGNKLTTAFITLMQPFGFSIVQGVVFAGDAGKAFAPVVGNGVLFKDGTGPTHGEYTHSLQWLLLCLNRGTLDLPQNVSEFYKKAVSYPGKYPVEEEMGRKKPITLWDFLVDCVLDDSSPRENLVNNILSNSWRTPAYVTRALTGGVLAYTWTGQHLLARINKRGDRFGEDYRTMRIHHHAKQYGKGEQMVRVSMAWIPREHLETLGIDKKHTTSNFVRGKLQGREVRVEVDLNTNSVILPQDLADELQIKKYERISKTK
ncbi:MAG TPA: LirA/MavJ family T4SS effector [Longimicrobium sp.]|nr:LirA/MavJ family T4SS effector [Longimicrobium sp.]